jgi:Amt family ammonium transporter
MDASIGALCWYFTGFGIAMGSGKDLGRGSAFGGEYYGLKNGDFTDGSGYSYALWLFQWAFCAATATIVSGAVAERCSFSAYVTYSVCLTAFIYPVVVHWGWNVGGWASAWRESDLLFGCGATDFAGSGVVHMTGGVAAFWGAWWLGPRLTKPELPPTSFVFQTLGVLILWFGWYGFNGVSTLYIVGYAGVAAKTMVTTTISAATCAICTVYFKAFYDKMMGYEEKIVIKLSSANNGVLAGLVSITAGCSTVDPYGAFIIGMIAAPVYVISSDKLAFLDDVVDAVPVHGVCGFYGVFMTGLFATKANYAAAYYGARAEKCAGAFYGGDGSLLGANFVLLIAIIAWTSTCSNVVFGALYKMGVLRVDPSVEEAGMDSSEHGVAPPSGGKKSSEIEVVDSSSI